MFGKLIWFFVAYSPLFFSLILKYCIQQELSLCYIIINIVVLSIPLLLLISLLYFIIRFSEDNTPRKELCEIKESINSEYVLFVVTYLIPFYNIDFSTENVIPTIFMFIIMALLYIKTPLFAINPILKLFKYNIYTIIKENNDKNCILISRKELANKTYKLGLIDLLSEDVYINTYDENSDRND